MTTLVFDVGDVLVKFRWRELMQDLGFDEDLIEECKVKMIESQYWHLMDRGQYDMDTAPAHFKSVIPGHEKELDLFWANAARLVSEFDYSAPMIRSLREKGYHVYLLSNYPLQMARLHWANFNFVKEVEGKIISAEEKLAKPEPEIYQLLESRYGVDLKEAIFVDDKTGNVEAAKAVGMGGIVFKGYEDFKKQLLEYGIEL